MAGEGFALESLGGRVGIQRRPRRNRDVTFKVTLAPRLYCPPGNGKGPGQSPAGAFSIKNRHAALSGSATPAWAES
jgi:hypothetical protein